MEIIRDIVDDVGYIFSKLLFGKDRRNYKIPRFYGVFMTISKFLSNRDFISLYRCDKKISQELRRFRIGRKYLIKLRRYYNVIHNSKQPYECWKPIPIDVVPISKNIIIFRMSAHLFYHIGKYYISSIFIQNLKYAELINMHNINVGGCKPYYHFCNKCRYQCFSSKFFRMIQSPPDQSSENMEDIPSPSFFEIGFRNDNYKNSKAQPLKIRDVSINYMYPGYFKYIALHYYPCIPPEIYNLAMSVWNTVSPSYDFLKGDLYESLIPFNS